MTPERLAEIERLAAAATDGPWFCNGDYAVLTPEAGDHNDVISALNDRRVLAVFRFGKIADCAFTCHAREAVPAMAAEIRRLDAKHGELMRRFANHARGYNNMEEERDEARAEIRRLRAEVEMWRELDKEHQIRESYS